MNDDAALPLSLSDVPDTKAPLRRHRHLDSPDMRLHPGMRYHGSCINAKLYHLKAVFNEEFAKKSVLSPFLLFFCR